MRISILLGLVFAGLGQALHDKVSLQGVQFPKVVLFGDKLSVSVSLIQSRGFDKPLNYRVYENDIEVNSGLLKEDMDSGLDLQVNLPQGSYAGTYSIDDIVVSSQITRSIKVKVFVKEGTSDAEEIEVGSIAGIVHGMPGIVTLIPIAILLSVALLSSQALFALSLGLFLASTFINGFNPVLGFLRMLDYYTVEALTDSDNAKVVLFTFYLSGLIALIQKAGGAHGMAQAMAKVASDRWRSQWVTFFTGLLIFFDDFASCLIVGSNMQPVTDLVYLSREKLAFLVHATSSPPASLAPISSWIGFELGLIKDQMKNLDIKGEPFLMFLETIPSRFYPLYMLLFIVILLVLKRDFGPMLEAERRAFFAKRLVKDSDAAGLLSEQVDPLTPDEQTPLRWFNAVIPVLIVIITTVAALFVSGYYTQLESDTPDFSAKGLAGSGDPYGSLLYSSFLASIMSILIFRFQNVMSFKLSISVYIHGIKEISEPLLILIMAWSIGRAFKDLGAATFIVSALSTTLNPLLLPTLVFIISCIISFTTGTSWGTMSIMFPLVIPLVNAAAPKNHDLLVQSISSILTGAIFGDQCSPISGTSIISSLATKCPVRDHVTTQLPYALLVAGTSVVFGYLPVGFQAYPSWVGLILGAVFMSGVLFIIGTKTESKDMNKWDLLLIKLGKKPKVHDHEDFLSIHKKSPQIIPLNGVEFDSEIQHLPSIGLEVEELKVKSLKS